jgi:hypothetical protein
MTKPMIRIHNVQTNEIIDRQMTDKEFAEYEKKQSEAADLRAINKAEAEAKASAKLQLLDKLGITEDEAKLLLG